MRRALTERERACGQRAVDFIETLCRHVKGEWAGRPLVLQQWERDFVMELFGRLREDGTRQYRKAYVSVARKNGKSTLGAAIALYLLVADGEPGAEVYSAAADRDQAAIVFDVARSMVEEEAELAKRVGVFRRSLVYRKTASAYHVLSADVHTKHGKNAHGVIFDELHTQQHRHLYDVLNTSMGARRQPLLVMFTTAGFDKESICWETHDYACKVRDGIVDDPTFLPVIYELPEDAEWTDERLWVFANPGLGESIKVQYLREECARAKESPAYQNTFRRLHLNQWTEQDTRWIDMGVWAENGGLRDDLNGADCYVGIDASSTTDLTAVVLAFPDPDGTMDIVPYFFMPRDTVQQRARRDRVPYDAWAQHGWIELTDGNIVDHTLVLRRVVELGQRHVVREIGIDPYDTTQLQTQLATEGFRVVKVPQHMSSMSAPTNEVERMLLDRTIRHGDHPVLTWMASNVTVKHDQEGHKRPNKYKSTGRIDGIVAMIMAVGRASVQPVGSVYDDRGLVVV